jgi:hypothetical protein
MNKKTTLLFLKMLVKYAENLSELKRQILREQTELMMYDNNTNVEYEEYNKLLNKIY